LSVFQTNHHFLLILICFLNNDVTGQKSYKIIYFDINMEANVTNILKIYL
jgi:hypothetical protein